jgi:hypothetical protein
MIDDKNSLFKWEYREITTCVSSKKGPHYVAGTALEADREGSRCEGVGYGQGHARAVFPKR